MYRTCIFCSADLGSNDVLEFFPVGRRLAFDSRKGRLWAVCRKCTRWNLAPIEERWEAVEEAEKIFRDSRLRVQSENIGMAKMRDGTHLIRVGAALAGEVAAWRYGSQLVKRQRDLYIGMGAAAAAGVLIVAGIPLIAGAGIPVTMINPAIQMSSFAMREQAARRVVMKLPSDVSPTGKQMILRRRHLFGAKLDFHDGALAMSIAEPGPDIPWYRLHSMARRQSGERIILGGDVAQTLAARAMVDFNSKGASEKDVFSALHVLENAGSAESFIAQVGATNPVIPSRGPFPRDARRTGRRDGVTPRKFLRALRGQRIEVSKEGYVRRETGPRPVSLGRIEALALEMALHDESERRGMEGELAILEDAWREAEEIARIADALPDEPPEE